MCQIRKATSQKSKWFGNQFLPTGSSISSNQARIRVAVKAKAEELWLCFTWLAGKSPIYQKNYVYILYFIYLYIYICIFIYIYIYIYSYLFIYLYILYIYIYLFIYREVSICIPLFSCDVQVCFHENLLFWWDVPSIYHQGAETRLRFKCLAPNMPLSGPKMKIARANQTKSLAGGF